jgi:YceI-like domain
LASRSSECRLLSVVYQVSEAVLLSKRICGVALALLLAACAGHPRRGENHAQPESGARSFSLPAAGTYRIDAGSSELRVLVYRAGPMAHLGHNHVLVNRSLSGAVRVGGSLAQCSFEFSVPVDQFVVDDTQARRDEGADFPGEVPNDAKSGTLRNMLSAAQLNSARFPQLDVKSVSFNDSQGATMAELSVSVAGHDSTVKAPFSLEVQQGHLIASGVFELRQTELGIVPYSLLGGALQVKDAMQIKLTIVASTMASPAP